jgi:hypothetical protein
LALSTILLRQSSDFEGCFIDTGLHRWQFGYGGVFGGAWSWHQSWRSWRLDSSARHSLLWIFINCQVHKHD